MRSPILVAAMLALSLPASLGTPHASPPGDVDALMGFSAEVLQGNGRSQGEEEGPPDERGGPPDHAPAHGRRDNEKHSDREARHQSGPGPDLIVSWVAGANVLEWTRPAIPQDVVAYEVYSFSVGEAPALVGTTESDVRTFTDALHDPEEVYFVLPVLSMQAAYGTGSNPASSGWPRCSWFDLTPSGGTIVRPECLLPPPGLDQGMNALDWPADADLRIIYTG